MSDSEHQAGWSLVMPFVVVASAGGPYDDGAYVAGYEVGSLDVRLALEKPESLDLTLRTANLPQVDLVAMRHGYIVERPGGPIDPDAEVVGWTRVSLRRPVQAIDAPESGL